MTGTATFSIVSWNILSDRRPHTTVQPQEDRLTGIAETITSLSMQPHAIALYEVEGTAEANHAQTLAKRLGYAHVHWAAYGNSAQPGGIAVLTREAYRAESLTLDPDYDQRPAVILRADNLTIAATHWSWSPYRPLWRKVQAQRLLSELTADNKAVIVGDLNSLASQKPRRLVQSAGFSLATPHTGKTFPTEDYLINIPPRYRPFVARGVAIDAAYTKGLSVKKAGKFTGPSDHFGLWLEIEI